MKKRLETVILLIIMSVVFLVGCNNKKEEKEVIQTETQTEKKHLNVALYWFGENMDPANGWSGWTLTRAAVGETLVTVNEKMEIVGQLADSWENIDETTWKFHIRQGVTFHNGNPLTAEAVKSSIERSIKLNERGQSSLKIKNIEIDGEYVIFKTTEAYATFLASISEPLFVIVDSTVDTSNYGITPICTGPYKVISYESGILFETEAYDNYWGGKPACDSMTVYNIGDDNTRALALQSGEVDIAQGIKAGDLSLFTNNSDYNVGIITGTRVDFLVMNMQRDILKDKNIRLALENAVDYATIAKAIGAGAVSTRAPFPPSIPQWYDELKKPSFNLEEAKKFLLASGYKDTDGDGYVDKNGKNLEFVLYITGSNLRGHLQMSELLQSQLKNAGIKLNINITENISDIRKAGEFDLLLNNWQTASTGDPQWLLSQVYKEDGSANYGKYKNENLNKKIEELDRTFVQNERDKLTREIAQIIIDEILGIGLISQSNVNVSNSKVKNMKTYPLDYYFLTAETTISK